MTSFARVPYRVFITLDADLGASHPYRVLVQTLAEAGAKPNSLDRSKVRDGVSCRSQRAALTYANGVNHGLSHAGGAFVPIVWDVLLRPFDGGPDGTVYSACEMVRS